jgi:predicted nuclease of predicted toxin-antitoxin system
MKLRYAGTCRLCGGELPARQEAIYERATKSVRCVECPTGMVAPDAEPGPEVRPEPAAPGVAGASARQEYERRTARREERIRAKHPKIGGVILALSDDPQTTRAWASGAKGEVALGARLDEHASETIAVMHDRLIPGTKGQHRPHRRHGRRGARRRCEFLLDECISSRLAQLLVDAGHDVVHVSDHDLAGHVDDEVLAAARDDKRVLVSADTDFGELLVMGGLALPSLVLFRQGNRGPEHEACHLASSFASGGQVPVTRRIRDRHRSVPAVVGGRREQRNNCRNPQAP